MRRGMSPDEARRAALAALGGRTHWANRPATSSAADSSRTSSATSATARSALRRNPGFAVSAVLTIALAIAATTTVFSFVNTVYLRPLNVPRREAPRQDLRRRPPEFDLQLGFPAYQALRGRARSFDLVAAHYSTAPLYLTSRNESAEVIGAVVSSRVLPDARRRPVLGRFFSADEDAVPDRDAVAMIGYGLWQSRFGGDPRRDRRARDDQHRVFTVIGVAPEGSRASSRGGSTSLWIPAMMLHTGYRWCDAFERTCPITR